MKGKTVLRNQLNEQAESYFDKLKQGLGFEGPPEVNEKIRDDGSTEPFTPKVDKPDSDDPPPSTVPTPSGGGDNNNDDDGPGFAPVATQEQISQAQEQATSSAIASGATQEEAEQAGAIAGGQMGGKGYVGGYGFKKGGLASRRK